MADNPPPLSLQAPVALPDLGPDALKACFKAKALATGEMFQNWQIRVHRAISWLKRAVEFRVEDQPKARFLYLWISLNALYSRWNAEKNAPDTDGASRETFFRKVCRMDEPLFGSLLHKHHGLVKKVLQNPYISSVFWRDPEHPKAKGWAAEDSHYLDRNFKQHDYCRVLEQVMQRLFVLRGQIVHGASTGGSKLNRASLSTAMKFLEAFVPVIVHVVIERGAGDDWPELCYRPVK